jgi:N-sulfoglucosamine sulfohydrolase
MFGLAHCGFSLNDCSRHLLHWLRPRGYHSTLIGVQHIAKQAAIIGYDEVVATNGVHVAEVAPAARNFLKRPPNRSFFLAVGFFENASRVSHALTVHGTSVYLRRAIW